MKKTLIITLEYPPSVGGIATYVHDLANALDPEQTIVLAPPHKDQKTWDAGVRYTIIRKKLLFPKWVWPRWLRLLFVVRRIIKTHGVALIFVQHVLPVGYAAIRMKKKFGVPFLLFSHGTDLVAGTQTAWKKWMVTLVSKAAEQIIFNSESLKRRFLQVLPQFDAASTVLYPCPDSEFFEPEPTEDIEFLRRQYALQGKHVILSVSRLTDGKGFPHLIRMMPELLQRVPHLVWIIVGDGDKRDIIMQEIQKRNLQNVTRFIGEIPHASLKKFYYLADLFVLLTHPDEGREEGLGLVFLEAAAAGLPVVAGKSGGVEEAVIHAQTGIVVDVFKGDQAIITAIADLFFHEKYRKQLGVQAQTRIKSDFLWKHQIKRIERWIG